MDLNKLMSALGSEAVGADPATLGPASVLNKLGLEGKDMEQMMKQAGNLWKYMDGKLLP
jgi:hypothetical protein